MNSYPQKRQLDQNRYGLTFFFVLFCFLVLDQWTKYLVSSQMQVGQSVSLPVQFVQITFVRNFGGAFGVLVDAHIVFFAAALLAVGCVYWQFPFICAETGKPGCVVSAMIVAGALGNLCDRLRLGYVVDMIDLKWWPVFNVADIGITVGITIMAIWMFRVNCADEGGEMSVSAGEDGIKADNHNEADE